MVKLSKLEQQKLDEMVKEFDWKFYVSYYDLPIKTEKIAISHFKNYGFKEGRICCQKQVIIVETHNSVPVIIPVTETITETIIDPVLKKDIYDISIVMAYYNDRKLQTLTTLNGFERMYAGKYNFEVIIVDDNSNDENKLEEDIKKYSFPINLIVISAEEKGDRINPCIAYNRGFSEATGKIIIIQNPECFHVGDLIKYTMDNLTEQYYFSYSCYTSNSFEITNKLLTNSDPYELIKDEIFNEINFNKIYLSWYNHPTEPGRNVGYHFCSSIYKSKLDLIGGFDERFSDGYCFDDDELLLSIKYNLQLDIKIIHPDDGFVVHQFHTRNSSFNIDNAADTNPIKIKWLKNKNLFEEMKQYHEEKQFNYPKLLHLYWDGSPLSYLNLITVLSFNEYHKFWKINVFMPTKQTDTISWTSNEQKIKYDGKCYFHKLYDIPNVFINKIDLYQIGFYNDAPEVIKSDYFRYYILQKHGGLWSDFDIIYTASVEDKMNFKEDTVIFKCTCYDEYIHKTNPYIYYPVGLFLSKQQSSFFKYIVNLCSIYYNPSIYQCLGASMFNKLFIQNNTYTFSNIKICSNELYLPFAWNQLDEMFIKENNVLPNNNIGIHWFNGGTQSKIYANKLESRLANFNPICYIDKQIHAFMNVDKITIVMTYYNRRNQILQTLKKFNELYSNYNLEVIIVDDCSEYNEQLFLTIQSYNFKIKLIRLKNKSWINPVVAYNIGISHISEDTKYVIIQNSEILHCNDIIKYTISSLTKNPNNYLSFNVFNSPSFSHNDMVCKVNNNTYYNNFVCKINYNDYDYDYKFYCSKYNKNYINEEIAYEDYLLNGLHNNHQCNEQNIFYRKNVIHDWKGWYNHYEYNNRNLHFLTALTYNNLKKIGGFSNDMKDGLWYDDDDFKYRINKICNIEPVKSNIYFGIHLHHASGSDDQHLSSNFNELITTNKTIYENNILKNVIFCEPYFKCDYNIYDNNKKITIGLCFKIYVNDDKTNKKRYDIIDEFLKSITNMVDNYNNLIVIGIIDCKLTYKLKQLLKKYANLKFIYLNENKGISIATNIGIEYLLNCNCDYIFCSDDDIIIKDNNVLNVYIESMIINNINHLCFYPLEHFKADFKPVNTNLIQINDGFSGCFYCFTSECIHEFGYLPVLDKKYGYEHEMFTKFVVKHNYDIINSSKYITLNSDSLIHTSNNSHSSNTYVELYELPKYISSNYWKNKINDNNI
jgi:glycosyltransferase involved in cell wall biosynthesis